MQLFLSIFLALSAAFGIGLFLIAPRLFHRPDSKPFCRYDYAHRGLHNKARFIEENTLPAFRAAVGGGWGIELDVRLTRDGVPVVFHDDNLLRLFGRHERISKLSLRQLLCYRFPSGEAVPEFSQVLAEIKGRVPLLIELKTQRDTARLCEAVFRLLDVYDGDFAIESFDPTVLHWLRKNRPRVFRGQLLTHFSKEQTALPRPALWAAENLLTSFWTRPDFVAYNWHYRKNLSLRLAKKVFGLTELSWTVSDVDTYNELKEDGAVCIFEDFEPPKDSVAVAVIGSRGVDMSIDAFIPAQTSEIITGGAEGVDQLAEQYAREHNLPCTVIRPDYSRYGRAAPLVRNREIIERADLVVAIWDGVSKGTKNSLDYARKLNKEVRIYKIGASDEDFT